MMGLLLGVLTVATTTGSVPLKSAGCSKDNLQFVKNNLGGAVLILS